MKGWVRTLFCLLLLINLCNAFGQVSKDGLLKKLKAAQGRNAFEADTGSVLLYNQLSYLYLYENADSALYYAKQALRLAQSQNFISGQARSWQTIGRAYYVIGDYDLSMDAATKLSSLSHQVNYVPGIAGGYLIAALIYQAQNKHSEALADFSKALQMFTALKDSSQVDKIYLDLGINYDDSGDFSRAFESVATALNLATRIKDEGLIPMAVNRQGDINFHIKNYKEALVYYNRVIASPAASKWEQDFAWSGVAQCDYALGIYREAITAAQKSYVLSTQVKSGSDAARALEVLSESYAATGDYKNAFSRQVEFKKLNDSLYNSDKDREINSLHLKDQQADNNRLANELKLKEQELALRQRLFLFRNIIAIATAIFVIFIIISNRQKTVLNKVLKKRNDDISLQKEEISKQKEVLDSLNRTKNQLFSVISHDLRGPFAAILQSIEAIRSGDLTAAEQAGLMEEFYRQVSLVTIMVNNLLAWANTQQEGIKSSPEKLDVVYEVEDIIAVSDFLARNKNISIEHDVEGGISVFADPDHIRIIIQNLIGNAIKFTPKGGSIKVFYTENGDEVGIHIRDTGVGVKPDKLKKLFIVTGKDISAYGTSNEAGAGIGLALVKQFIDANNGRLDVRSKYGEGSEFTVYLPKSLKS